MVDLANDPWTALEECDMKALDFEDAEDGETCDDCCTMVSSNSQPKYSPELVPYGSLTHVCVHNSDKSVLTNNTFGVITSPPPPIN